jgi:hypothetical protein
MADELALGSWQTRCSICGQDHDDIRNSLTNDGIFQFLADLGSTKNPKKSGTWIFHIFRFRAFIARHDSANDFRESVSRSP